MFKKGDVITRIREGDHVNRVTKGKNYTVLEVFIYNVKVIDDGVKNTFTAKYFKLYKPLKNYEIYY